MQQYQKVISLKFCYCRIWGGVAFDIPLGRKSACVGPRKDCEISLLVLLVHGPRSAFIMFIYACSIVEILAFQNSHQVSHWTHFLSMTKKRLAAGRPCRFRHITLTELNYIIIYMNDKGMNIIKSSTMNFFD